MVKAKVVDQGLASAAVKKVTSPVTAQAKAPAEAEEEGQMMIAKSRLLETDGTPLVAGPLVGTNGQVVVTLLLKNQPMVGAMLATTLQQTCLGGNSSQAHDRRRGWTASHYCTTFNALVVGNPSTLSLTELLVGLSQ